MEQNSTKEVIIRTMDADVKALEQGGGEIVTPEPIRTEEVKSFEIPGYLGPEKPIFVSHSEVISEKASEHHKSVSRGLKITGVIILVLLIIAAFGFLGYFVVSYFISSNQMPAVQ